MNVSLDDLIKSKRSSFRRGQGGSRGGGFSGGGGSNFRSNRAGDGDGFMRRGWPMATRPNGFRPYWMNNVNASWTHGMYDGPKRQQMQGGISTNMHKIVISNLDFGVTSTDLKDLFEEFGSVKTAAVHYDISGCSLGTANIIFNSNNAALNAIRQYNNVPLDGRPMKIELATDLSTFANVVNEKPAPKPEQGTRRGGFRRNQGNTRAGRGNNNGNFRGCSDGSRVYQNAEKRWQTQ